MFPAEQPAKIRVEVESANDFYALIDVFESRRYSKIYIKNY